jgi:hypothetical protein
MLALLYFVIAAPAPVARPVTRSDLHGTHLMAFGGDTSYVTFRPDGRLFIESTSELAPQRHGRWRLNGGVLYASEGHLPVVPTCWWSVRLLRHPGGTLEGKAGWADVSLWRRP